MMSRRSLCYNAELLLSWTENPTEQDIEQLNKIIKYCQTSNQQELNFIHIDLKSAKLLLFTDASFANTRNYKSQLGCVIVFPDNSQRVNVVHYRSCEDASVSPDPL